MHSFHIIGSRRLGGAESFFMRLVGALDARPDHRASAIVRPGSGVERELAGRVALHPVAMRGRWDLPSRWAVSRLVRRQRPDIVQTYMTRATVTTHLPPGRGTVHVARLGGFYKIARFTHAHAWVGNTRAICDYLIEGGMAPERVFYIGNFVEPPEPLPPGALDALHKELSIPPGARVILALGRMVEKKGFQDLLPAFAALPAETAGRPNHLLLVGDGPLRGELEAQAGSLGIAGRVHWAGWQTRTSPYYQLADLFVCPSRHEPLGNVILEAWNHRLPVLSTASHGALELIEEGTNGLLVPCGDVAALTGAMEELLRCDQARLAALGEAGWRRVEADYRPEVVVGAYLDLYRKLLGR